MAQRPQCKGKCGALEHDGRLWPNDHIVWDIILELTRHYCCITCFLKHEFGPHQNTYPDLYAKHEFKGDHGGRCHSKKKSIIANDTSGTGDDVARWDNSNGGGSFRSMIVMVHVETASGEPSGRVTDDVASNIDWWSDWHGGGAINDLKMTIGILWNK